MLYRRHLRIQALQALYAYFTGSVNDLVKGEKELLKSVNQIYELFVWQLSFIVEIKRFAEYRIEENKKKFYPTEEDLNPNLKFVENKAINYVENNRDFRKKEELFKIRWTDDEKEIIRKFYMEMRESDYYKKYMANPKRSFNEDKLFVIKMVDLQLSNYDLLKSFYEEKSIYFAGNYDLVNILLIKFFDSLTTKHNEFSPLPGIYKTENAQVNDDKEFLKTLYRKVIVNSEEYDEILKKRTNNWEYDRIPLMDLILLKMAIVELTEMPLIPVKVTMNEYIELAKYFSTPKSKTFVNGVLDKLIRDFNEEGKIKKTGRGLIQ